MLVLRHAKGKEDSLIERYIKDGPSHLREELGLSEAEWKVIFDYLAFNHNLLYKTVTQAEDFFVDSYIEHGITHVRDILDINDVVYDAPFEVAFDFIAMSQEGLYHHVLQHRDRYVVAFKARGGDFVRKVLGIWKDKYDEHWAQILDLLLHTVCDGLFSEASYDQGLRVFSNMMNAVRIHRPVEKSEITRKNLV